MAKQKCKCGLENYVFCTNCSAVKIAIMLKNGQKHLKIHNPNTGRNENPCWFSPVKYNHKDFDSIVSAMLKAFNKRTEFSGAVNCLMIYNNQSKSFYKKITM